MVDFADLTPPKMTGREFEDICHHVMIRLEEYNVGSFGRYGGQAVRTKDDWQILQSLPDFEGIINGRQFIFDCKVNSSASFDWTKYRTDTRGSKSRQLRHLIKRSSFGAKCGFLMHWNRRVLTKRTVEPKTFWMPVDASNDYWSMVEGGVVKSLTLLDCETMGIQVQWTQSTRERRPRPDLRELFSRLNDR